MKQEKGDSVSFLYGKVEWIRWKVAVMHLAAFRI